jgi:hypothetical protein
MKNKQNINNDRRKNILKSLQVILSLGLVTLLPSFTKAANVKEGAEKKTTTKPSTAVWG